MGRGGVAVATVMGTVRVKKTFSTILDLLTPHLVV